VGRNGGQGFFCNIKEDVQMSLTCFKEEKRYVPRVIDPNGFNKVVPFNYMIKKVKKLNGSNFKSRSDKDGM
jgi:hypothetical protein